jgi:hypothetical protein
MNIECGITNQAYPFYSTLDIGYSIFIVPYSYHGFPVAGMTDHPAFLDKTQSFTWLLDPLFREDQIEHRHDDQRQHGGHQ